MNDILSLISEEQGFDLDGFETVTQTEKEVFCKVKSVSRAEFYSALQNNIKLNATFVISCDDYNKEQKIKYNDKTYRVVREYKVSEDYIELNCEAL